MRLHQQLSVIPALWAVAKAYFSTSVGDFTDNDWEYLGSEEGLPSYVNVTGGLETLGTYPPCGFGIYPKLEDTYNSRYHPEQPLPVFPIRGGSWINFGVHGLGEYKFTLSRGPDDPWHEFYPPIVTYGSRSVCFNTKNHQGLLEKIWPATEDPIGDQPGWIQIQGKLDDTFGKWRYACIAVNFTARTPAEEPNKCANASYGAAPFNYRESDTDLEWTCTPGVYDFGDGFTASSSCSPQIVTSALSSPTLTPASLTSTSTETTGEATTTTSQVPAESTTSGTAPDADNSSSSATTSTEPEATGAAGRLQGDSSFGAIVAAIGAGVMILGSGQLL